MIGFDFEDYASEETQREIVWFDPLTVERHNVLPWDDAVHDIVMFQIMHGRMAYGAKCGKVFSFPVLDLPVEEARIKLPEVTCQDCLAEDSE
jgi:hypothetical protein